MSLVVLLSTVSLTLCFVILSTMWHRLQQRTTPGYCIASIAIATLVLVHAHMHMEILFNGTQCLSSEVDTVWSVVDLVTILLLFVIVKLAPMRKI